MFQFSFAIISGDNPLGTSPKHNKTGNQSLAQDLYNSGYKAIDIQGTYGGKIDNALLVLNISLQASTNFARTYGQESFIWSDGRIDGTFLIFTETGNAFQALSITTVKGKDDYTYVPALEIYFSYNFDWGTTYNVDQHFSNGKAIKYPAYSGQ